MTVKCHRCYGFGTHTAFKNGGTCFECNDSGVSETVDFDLLVSLLRTKYAVYKMVLSSKRPNELWSKYGPPESSRTLRAHIGKSMFISGVKRDIKVLIDHGHFDKAAQILRAFSALEFKYKEV